VIRRQVETASLQTTVMLDDELLAEAMALSGIEDEALVLHEALRALIAREAARRLAATGGRSAEARGGRRRRTPAGRP
jgi:Arc/MetJ family transcription regulator